MCVSWDFINLLNRQTEISEGEKRERESGGQQGKKLLCDELQLNQTLTDRCHSKRTDDICAAGTVRNQALTLEINVFTFEWQPL